MHELDGISPAGDGDEVEGGTPEVSQGQRDEDRDMTGGERALIFDIIDFDEVGVGMRVIRPDGTPERIADLEKEFGYEPEVAKKVYEIARQGVKRPPAPEPKPSPAPAPAPDDVAPPKPPTGLLDSIVEGTEQKKPEPAPAPDFPSAKTAAPGHSASTSRLSWVRNSMASRISRPP